MYKLVIRSIKYYRRQHVATIAAIALCTAILTGAFIIGDSVRGSLHKMISERLGNAGYALELKHRFVQTKLAEKISQELDTPVIPVLSLNGVISVPGKDRAVRSVRIHGIDSSFYHLSANGHNHSTLAENEILINTALAGQLNVEKNDFVVLKFHDLGFLPGDTPIAGNMENIQARRYKIGGIVGPGQMGHYNLRINQVAPENVFIPLKELQQQLDLAGYVNTLLIAQQEPGQIDQVSVDAALHDIWDFTSAGFELIPLQNPGLWELRSQNIFIEDHISHKILNSGISSTPVFTYFVNQISSGDKFTPYSFISAAGTPVVPEDMPDSHIIVNRWLADDLNLAKNDSIRISYYVPGINNKLLEKSRSFAVHAIVPLSGKYTDQELLPDFPGLSDVDNCRDWQPGIPIDLDLIRDKDEDYWDAHRGTPKAFVTINAAQDMWQNRFGNCTAIRISANDSVTLVQQLSEVIPPAQVGFYFNNIRTQAQTAVNQSVDFGELFFGLSFFMIVSALLLIALIFRINMEQRLSETGLYFALGFRPKTILKIMLYEGLLISFIAAIIGVVLSGLYSQIILFFLNSVWRGATGTSTMNIYISLRAISFGLVISLVIVFLSIFLSIRRYAKQNIHALTHAAPDFQFIAQRKFWFLLSLGIVGIVSVFFIIASTDVGRSKEAAGAYFASGALLLTTGMIFIYVFLAAFRRISFLSPLYRLAFQNSTRNKARSLILVGVLASSLFIVFTVGANRNDADLDALNPASGTGGFQLVAQTTLPIDKITPQPDANQILDLSDPVYQEVQFVNFRLRDGDDASCLNLNRTTQPKLLGVDPGELAQRNVFSFNSAVAGINIENAWQALDNAGQNDVIPGIADETVIIWGLGKSVGDTVTYLSESGKLLNIRLVAGLSNSIFQGHIIISEQNLLRYFPAVSGYRFFLVQAEPDKTNQLMEKMTWSLQDYGILIQTTAQRLAAFNEVENTYLSIFLILGGFAIIMGTMGLGIIVAKSILERKSELAIMRSVGFSRQKIQQLIVAEHTWLLILGLLLGLIAALVSVLPAILAANTHIPFLTIVMFLIAISASGFAWTFVATHRALKQNLITALRSE